MIGHDARRPVGQIFRVRNWDHWTKDVTIKYGVGRGAKHVMIMACLGEEPLDIFRHYFSAYARDQAYCHLSPALIANLEREWNAHNRKI